MRITIYARLVKRLGLLIVYVALVRGVAIFDYICDWNESYKGYFHKDVNACIHPLLQAVSRDDAAVSAICDANALGEVEGKILYSRMLSHPEVAQNFGSTWLCVAIGYALYLLASAVDKSFCVDNVRYRTWFGLSLLILVPLFFLPFIPRRLCTSEKSVARCREIMPPQNLDSNVKTLMNIILDKEAVR